MKKLFLFVVIPSAIIFGGWYAHDWKTEQEVKASTEKYGMSEQRNKQKSGSAVWFDLLEDDDAYLFVRDFKRNPTHPQFLGYMNYTSTQGSYEPKWSKDEQMIAVYNESADHFPELKWPKWVIGYDWNTGRVLHSKEIPKAFKRHGGVGANFPSATTTERTPSPRELGEFEPQKLSRGRAMP